MNKDRRIGMLLNCRRCMLFVLLIISNAVNASIWMPTASDVNFFSFGGFGGWVPTGTIGIFEGTDSITAASTPVVSFSDGATVSFAQNGSNWDIKVVSLTATGSTSSTETLLGSNQFQLGWRSNGAWVPQTGSNANPWTPNFWQLTFVDSSLPFNNTDTLYATNIKIITSSSVAAAIPLPAAAWSYLGTIVG